MSSSEAIGIDTDISNVHKGQSIKGYALANQVSMSSTSLKSD